MVVACGSFSSQTNRESSAATGGLLGMRGCVSFSDRFSSGDVDGSVGPDDTAGAGATDSGGGQGRRATDGSFDGEEHEFSASEPAGYPPEVPIPSNLGEFGYPVMGSGDAKIVNLVQQSTKKPNSSTSTPSPGSHTMAMTSPERRPRSRPRTPGGHCGSRCGRQTDAHYRAAND